MAKNYEITPENILDIFVPGVKDFTITNIERNELETTIYLESQAEEAVCPHCGNRSIKAERSYHRKIEATPANGKSIYLDTKVHQFKCEHCESNGNQKSFSEPLAFCKKFQRRTEGYNKELLTLLPDNGFSGTERIIEQQGGSNCSKSSMTRLLSRVEVDYDGDYAQLGIDDFAVRKNHSYWAIIVNKKTHEPVCILGGRTADDIRPFFEEHKDEVEMLNRDRSTSFSSVASELCPALIEVADPFHLYQNLNDQLSQTLREILPGRIIFREEKLISEEESVEIKKQTKVRLTGMKAQEREELALDILCCNGTLELGHKKRLDILSDKFGITEKKIKSLIKKYSNYTIDDLFSGRGKDVFTDRNVEMGKYQNLTVYRRKEIITTILAKSDKKSERVVRNMDKLASCYPEVGAALKTIAFFREVMEGDDPDALDSFIENFQDGIASRFVQGLKKDAEAVKNAIKYRSSSGYVEGLNCKIKLLKRKGYGRYGRKTLEKLLRLSYLLDKTPYELTLSEKSAKI